MDRQSFADDVSGIAALKEPVRRDLYLYVAGQAGTVGRDEGATALGIDRALAAFHLDRLVDEGLLEVEYRRLSGRTGPGAGRPAKLYRRSAREIEVSLPQRRYDVAGKLLARAVAAGTAEDAPGSALQRTAREYGGVLADEVQERAGRRAGKRALHRAALEVLVEHGFEPVAGKDGIVLRNCPFAALAEDQGDVVCGMNLDLLRGLVDGLGDRLGLAARLAPEPGRCCVRLQS